MPKLAGYKGSDTARSRGWRLADWISPVFASAAVILDALVNGMGYEIIWR